MLAKGAKIRVKSEKGYGGAGLKRPNRSRKFSADFTRHKQICENYGVSQGLMCKKLGTAPMVDGGYCNVPPFRDRARLHLAAFLGYRLSSQANANLL